MTIQVPPLHSPADMREISNLAHQLEGGVLGIAALLALAAAAERGPTGRARLAWPALVLAAGILLLGYLLVPHHGLRHATEQWAFIFGDPQQRQHVIVALLATAGGAAELRHRAGRAPGAIWSFGWPAAAALAGALFVRHPQHGTGAAVAQAVAMHRVLGVLLIATGALRAAEVRWASRARWLAFPWTLTLLAAAALLALYREPEGAYVAPHGGHEPRAPANGPGPTSR